jgi:HEAT repeats
VIEVYGAKRTAAAEVRQLAGVIEGGRLPISKGAVEDRLREMRGVADAALEATCCEDGKIILYIGIQEAGSPRLPLRGYPSGAQILPSQVNTAYFHFLEQVREAGRSGGGTEDLSQGHSLLSHPAAREAQLAFVQLANEHTDELRKVLRESGESEDRAIAAYILGYHREKKAVTEDLAYALNDPDPTVRGNAARALAAIAVLAEAGPSTTGIRIKPSWFINLLHSPFWTDRNNGAVALVTLTEQRNPKVLAEIRTSALPELTEMARWKHPPHALPAFILLGRVGGISEDELQRAWSKGEGKNIIDRVSSGKKQEPPGRP